jgi:hypothetical protein
MSEWKCSYKACECNNDAEKSECDLAYKTKKMNKKEAFKYWGTMNGWNDEVFAQFRIAQEIHRKDQEENPDDHEYAPRNIQQSSRGYNKSQCKCGFGYYVDSSG